MRIHDIYAHAFLAACKENVLIEYQSYLKVCEIFDHVGNVIDSLVFDIKRWSYLSDLIQPISTEKVSNFLTVLNEDNMIDQYQVIARSIKAILIANKQWTECLIETPYTFKESTYEALKETVKPYCIGHTEYSYQVNPEIKAGCRIYINEQVIDLSIQGRLKKLLTEVRYG